MPDPVPKKKCPFCGARGTLHQEGVRVPVFSVICDNGRECGAEGPRERTAKAAVDKWDGRLAEPPLATGEVRTDQIWKRIRRNNSHAIFFRVRSFRTVTRKGVPVPEAGMCRCTSDGANFTDDPVWTRVDRLTAGDDWSLFSQP